MNTNTTSAVGKNTYRNRKPSNMRRCPKCYHWMRLVKKNQVTLERCPLCKGAWFDHETLVKLWASMRQVQMSGHEKPSTARPGPNHNSLGPTDSKRQAVSQAQRDKRWRKLLEVFE